MFFIEHQIIIFVTKRIRLNFLLKPSDLKSDFTLTLGYLNLALNNPALETETLVHVDRNQWGLDNNLRMDDRRMKGMSLALPQGL